MTYQNYGRYRPHMDSADFMKFLRSTVIVAMILSIAFSVRGNYLGLKQTLENNLFWLTCIALGITITSALLSMLTVIRIVGLNKVGRFLIFVAAMGIFYISTRLTLIGFATGEHQKAESMVQTHPDLLAARKDLAQIIKRQRTYGISQSEKLSLLAREREQRKRIREIEDRIRIEENQETRVEQAMGQEAVIARQIFAIAPDLSIMVLSPILVLLYGLAGLSTLPRETERVVHIQSEPYNGQLENKQRNNRNCTSETNNNTNIHSEPIKNSSEWEPF